ncbi:uncharacterized protein LOC134696215 [Mytilus trossulus]|uniref:uncharacterized protein LOC134696215 n=1 Tax=Mytilus trossulus TaxID=6551 RepID=UPI00300517AC
MSISDEFYNKTSRQIAYSQDTVEIDPTVQAKLLEILKERFNITGVQALNQQFLDQLLKDYNMTREDFLASIDESTTKLTTKIVDSGDDGDSAISWGLIVPIVLIGVFLACVAGCLYWHQWRDKRRSNHHSVDRSVNTSFDRFSRVIGRTPTSQIDYVRGSTRSTTPLNISDKVNVVPLTSSNPGQFKFYWDKDNWKLCPPEDSLPHGALAGSRSSLLRQNLSPIDEMESPSMYTNTTRSYDVDAQPPFSPYHLTWLTPKAPPPSYEESELSSPDKSQRINTYSGYTGYSKDNTTDNTCSGCTGYSKTNTTDNTCSGYTGYSKTNTTDNTCSGYTGYSKNTNSPFYPNNNTPTTDFYEFTSEHESLPPKVALMANSYPLSNGNSRFTSYPSTPHSSLESLSESQVDTVEEISYRRHNTSHDNIYDKPDNAYNRNSQFSHYRIETDHNRNSVYSANENYHSQDSQSSNYNTARDHTSQYEEEYSMGVPSLPSSILYYHQKMTNVNVMMSGKPPLFSPHAFRTSQASSLESSDTNYTDNTSMLPCVGSSITSGNPTGISSLHQTNSVHTSMGQQHPAELSENVSPEDLSKIVDELSSIRPGSNEPTSVNHGIINSMIGYEGPVGQSYVADIYPPQQQEPLTGNFNQNITELFRSWSVTAELDYSSVSSQGAGTSMQTPLNEGSFSWDTYPLKKNTSKNLVAEVKHGRVVTDVNHNVVSLNNLPQPGRNVQFSVPVLVDKTYWV